MQIFLLFGFFCVPLQINTGKVQLKIYASIINR
jgi:hypothetical protein